MFCKQCGTQLKDTAKFCPGCGAKVEKKATPSNTAVCAKCGMVLKAGVKFCKQCGTPVTVPKAEPKNTCHQCGGALRPGAKFCKKCGAAANSDSPTVTIPITEPAMDVTASKELPTRVAWICPECSMALKSGSDFCPECSLRAIRRAADAATKPAPQPKPAPAAPSISVCSKCGTELKASAEFCNACGTLTKRQAAEHGPTAYRPGPIEPQEMKTKPKKRKAKWVGLVASILAVVLVMQIVPLKKVFNFGRDTDRNVSLKVLKKDSGSINPQSTVCKIGDVTVDVGEYVLEDEQKIVVQKLSDQKAENGDWSIVPYDISIGSLTTLDDFISIRIPYNSSFCDKGENPAKCVGAKYRNEQTGQWEDVLFDVDTAAQELVIYTDHLSTYGAFHVKNEGMRNAYISDINDELDRISEEEATAVLREFINNGGTAGEKAIKLAAATATTARKSIFKKEVQNMGRIE